MASVAINPGNFPQADSHNLFWFGPPEVWRTLKHTVCEWVYNKYAKAIAFEIIVNKGE